MSLVNPSINKKNIKNKHKNETYRFHLTWPLHCCLLYIVLFYSFVNLTMDIILIWNFKNVSELIYVLLHCLDCVKKRIKLNVFAVIVAIYP